MSDKDEFALRPATEQDIKALMSLERRVYGPLGTGYYGEDHIRCWLEVFPDGFSVVGDAASLVGYQYSQIICFDPTKIADIKTFDMLTDCGYTRNSHQPTGNAAAVVSMCSVHRGAGRILSGSVFALAARYGLRYVVGFSRLPGFDRYCQELEDDGELLAGRYDELEVALSYSLDAAESVGCRPSDEYLQQLGRRFRRANSPDEVLRKHARQPGIHLAAVLPNFMTDPESRHFTAVVVSDLTALKS
ncbi:MAG: hypothetical protein V1738_02290 [Patescibacteria group bacterium]